MLIRMGKHATAISLGFTQIIGWGSVLYFPAALGRHIASRLHVDLHYVFLGVSVMYAAASLISPWIGRKIDERGARSIMTVGSLAAALGFLCLSVAQTLAHYIVIWVFLGIIPAATLSNAAYAALAQTSRDNVGRSFTILIFATGFAGTVCLPAISLLGDAFGWRAVAASIAAVHLIVCAPLHWFSIPAPASSARSHTSPSVTRPHPAASTGIRVVIPAAFIAVSVALAFNIFVTTGLALHLFNILIDAGFSKSVALYLFGAIGPIQVSLRAVQVVIANRINPITWGLVGAMALPVGIGLLLFAHTGSGSASTPIAAGFILLFSLSNALMVVARATIPYAIYGSSSFGSWMGRLGASQNLASAVTPIAFAFALENWKAQGAILLALGASTISLLALIALYALRASGKTTRM